MGRQRGSASAVARMACRQWPLHRARWTLARVPCRQRLLMMLVVMRVVMLLVMLHVLVQLCSRHVMRRPRSRCYDGLLCSGRPA